ncbi:hypothetical protein GD1_136 [Paraglaciecola Antarctic GD virus 1]|nr:hypothetical protein GD1_136 [Paraglaciecola Antarctic GD virus 1]
MTAQPFKGRKGFDSNSNRVINVSDAVQESDAVPLKQMKTFVATSIHKSLTDAYTYSEDKSTNLKYGTTICTNKQDVSHTVNDGKNFTVSNCLASGKVSLTSRHGIINPYLDNSETVGRSWDKLDIPNNTYSVDSAQGHLMYDRNEKKLYALGDKLSLILDLRLQDFSVNNSGTILAYVTDRKLYKTNIEQSSIELLLDECSLVDVSGNSITAMDSQGDVRHSIDGGKTFKKIKKLIPQGSILATALEPCLYHSKQIQYGGKVHTANGVIKYAVSTAKGVLFVSDEQAKCSLHLMNRNGKVTKVKEVEGYYQAFDANYDLTKIVLLVKGSLSISSVFGYWNDYKTDLLAKQLSLTSNGESLLAIGTRSYISKCSDNNTLTKMNGFTMKANSTVSLTKSDDHKCYVVVNETAEIVPTEKSTLKTNDVWIEGSDEELIVPEQDINLYLPAEPLDNFRCHLTVVLCEDHGIVTLKGSGKTLNNVEEAIVPIFKFEGNDIFRSYDEVSWKEVKDESYDEFVKVDDYVLNQGTTHKFVYIESKKGWYSY